MKIFVDFYLEKFGGRKQYCLFTGLNEILDWLPSFPQQECSYAV